MIIRSRPQVCWPCCLQSCKQSQRNTIRLFATVRTPNDEFADPVPIQRFPPTQPPSHKPAHLRKTQLHRQYTSLLQSTPLLLIFQHNNLRANEWAAIRRELAIALRAVSAKSSAEASALGVKQQPLSDDIAAKTRLQIITTNIFEAALRTLEHYKPPSQSSPTTSGVSAPDQHEHTSTHYLSSAAHRAGQYAPTRTSPINKKPTTLSTLLSGPIAILEFPSLAPAHLAAALRILAPTSGASSEFAAPKRKDAPGLYEGTTQAGLQKLMLLGARVEGHQKAFDEDRLRRVAGLGARGGLEGLRAEVVGLLQGVGMGLVGGLQGVSMGVWGALEGRRQALEAEGKDAT